MPSHVPVKALIFDWGDVLFQWSRNTETPIPPSVIEKIVSSPPWHLYESGQLSQLECYERVARQFGLDNSEVAEAFVQMHASLQPDAAVVAFIKGLRKDTPVRIYVMSNIAKEDFQALGNMMDPALFDGVFTSGAYGMRMPDQDFYNKVLEDIDLEPEEVVFINDRHDNVAAATDLGIRGLVFDERTVQTLRGVLDEPATRARNFLHRNAKKFQSETDSGIYVGDNFASLLILEATQEPCLVDIRTNREGTWNFFSGEATLVPGGVFPDDLDTTSLALIVQPPEDVEAINAVLNQMAECVLPDGLFLTYFDRQRPRIDTVVSANILACFYRFGRGHEFLNTLEHIHDFILHRGYLEGTRYYPLPDCCLYFFSRLLVFAERDIYVQSKLGPLLYSRLEERVGVKGSALDLAMRILACDSLGIDCGMDRQALLRLQHQDGSWELGWMYRYGSTGLRIGNQGVTVAMSLKALMSQRSLAATASEAP